MLIALLVLPILSALGQTPLLDTGYRQMYNLQFAEAHQSFHEWGRQHPDDPMAPVSDAAAYLFSEFDRMHILQSDFFLHDDTFLTRRKPNPDPILKQDFERALDQAQQLASRILDREPQNENAMFANALGHGLHADYLALVEKRYLASLSEVKNGRTVAEKLIAIDPGFCDAYLAIGVENYLLGLKPAPVRWLFRVGGAQTDRNRGIEDLSVTAERGHYLLPYARVLLTVAALRDKNWPRAKELLEGLVKEFPRNPLYAQELARLH